MLSELSFDWMQEEWIADCDEGTCHWIFNNKEWNTWLLGSTIERRPLWISGSPGMGKTVLSKFIAKELRQGNPSMITLSYFFDESIAARSTFKGLLRSLLHQLLSLDKELLNHFHINSKSTKEPLSTSTLQKYLASIFQDAEFAGAFIVIDAVDECANHDTLLKFIREQIGGKIRLVITSKPNEWPASIQTDLANIPLDGVDSSQTAVREYLRHECQRVLPPLSDTHIKEFQAKFDALISQVKSLTFLWIRLAVRLIAMQTSLRHCRQEFNTLSKMKLSPNNNNMSALLSRYLKQVFTQRQIIPIEVLYILVIAKAPVSITGLSFFAAALFDSDLCKPDELLGRISDNDVWEPIISRVNENVPLKFEEEIKGLALIQHRDDAVSLMHDSLRHVLPEILDYSTTSKNGWPDFREAQAHFQLAEICLTYAIFALQAGYDHYHLLKYARLYWFEHILTARDINPDEPMSHSLINVVQIFFHMEIHNDMASSRSSEAFDYTVLRKWLIGYNNHDGSFQRQFLSSNDHDQFSERALMLAVLAAFDLIPALSFLVPNIANEDFSRPLSKSSDNPVSLNSLLIGNNSIRSLQWLHGSKAFTCISNWSTTYANKIQGVELTDRYLELIAESGTEKVMRFFIDAFKRDEVLLMRLASFHQKTAGKGHDESFSVLYNEVLAQHIGTASAADKHHIQKIAESAAELDQEDLVAELLEKWDLSPEHILTHAIQAGAEKTSEYLIKRQDVNVNKSYGPKGSILHIASAVGSKNIVNALIQKGCRLNAMDEHRRIPLHIACQSGNLDVCKLLLNMHELSLLNYADEERQLPLHLAAELCHAHIISLLLEEGSNVYAADEKGRAPLHLVCKQGSYSTAKILLQHGARVNVKDKSGLTPLHYAAMSANVELVWLLISYGASVSTGDDDGATPLHKASTFTSGIMVKRLVELGSDPNAEDEQRHTSLYYLFHHTNSPSRAVFDALMTNGAILNLREVGRLSNYTKWLEPYRGTGKIVEISMYPDDIMSQNSLTQGTWTQEESPDDSFHSALEIS
jgi:ankyrin repeat protein